MGKKSSPTAENSGMSKGQILKYLFVQKRPVNNNLVPDNKAGPPVVRKFAIQEQVSHNCDENSSSSDASTSSSSTGPATPFCSTAQEENLYYVTSSDNEPSPSQESQESLPLIAIDKSIFEKSQASQSQSSEVNLNGNQKNQERDNPRQHKADSGISDDTTSDDESSEEFPDITNSTETMQMCPNVPTSVIQYTGAANSKGIHTGQKITIEPFKFDPAQTKSRLPQKRNSLNERGDPQGNKKRRSSAGSSSSSSSTNADSSGSEKKNEKDKQLDTLIENKRWELAIPQLISKVEENIFPPDLVMAQVINDCILKTRRTSSKANELMEKVVSKCGEVDEDFEFILQAIRSVSAELDEYDMNANNCYWPMMADLIQNLILNAKANCAPDGKHVLRFFDTFVTLLERLFQIHANSRIHLVAPMVVRLFEGAAFDESPYTLLQNLKDNVTHLTRSLIEVQYYDAELAVLIRLIQLLARYYYGRIRRKKDMKEGLRDQFSSVLAGTNNYGFRILGTIKEPNFGKDVSLKIVENHINELAKFSAAEKVKLMTCLSKSKVIRRHHSEQPKFHVSAQDDICRVTKASNKAGESLLHRVCGDPKKNEKLDLKLNEVLNEIEKSTTGSVNVPDNGNNYPLHDAADNGRVEQLQILHKRCGAGQTNERLRLNPLLRNKNGDTALHLAAKKGNLKVVKLLVQIIGDKEKVELNLDMANNSGITPLNCSNHVQIKEYLQSLQPETPSWEEDFYFPECKVRLSPESVAKIKTDVFLQRVVMEFNNFVKEGGDAC